MPKRSDIRITKSRVDELTPGQTIWDSEIPGFGVVANKNSKTYKLKYRLKGTQYMLTIGTHGPLTVDEARKRAATHKSQVYAGENPAETKKAVGLTVEALCHEYMVKHAEVVKKPRSVDSDRANIKNHVVPLLGKLPVRDVNATDVKKFKNDVQAGKTAPSDPKSVQKAQKGGSPVTGGKGVANRCLALLSKMFNLAETWGMRSKGTNPVRGVSKYKENPKERFLSDDEIAQLWRALERIETTGDEGMQYPVAMVRLILLTGARRGEIQQLKWSMVDLENAKLDLPDSKTGRKTIHLPKQAVDELRTLHRLKGNPYVIVGAVEGKPLQNIRKPWKRIVTEAGLDNAIRLHDLRHTYASLAVRNGIDLYRAGKMLGHHNVETTQRYAHLEDKAFKETAIAIGDAISKLTERDKPERDASTSKQ